jgi:pyruvate dehydrogenase E2 component (dihydrolipoamide acetyltransferase)
MTASAVASPTANVGSEQEAGDVAPRTIPLTGMRGAISRNMGLGWQVPRVSQSVEVDMSRVEALRGERLAAGERPGVTACVLRAVALALCSHPRLNALMREKEVELVPEINLGVAVALEEGLMVPVVRNADTLPLAELGREVTRLADGARQGKLSPGTYQRGTFTVTSLGATAVDRFSPIINPPQIAILGVGRTALRPAVKEGVIAAVPMLTLTLVFDHRAVDGYPAALFLGEVVRRLEGAEFE